MVQKSEKKSKMDIIICSEGGILDTPLITDNEKKAKEIFLTIATQILGPEIKEINLDSNDFVDKINERLYYKGKEIIWFTDIEVE